MPEVYQAVVCRGFGEGETALEILERKPLLPQQVRVRLMACGVNYPDVLIVQGKYQQKPEFPFVPGTEGAGVVIETGDGVPSSRMERMPKLLW